MRILLLFSFLLLLATLHAVPVPSLQLSKFLGDASIFELSAEDASIGTTPSEPSTTMATESTSSNLPTESSATTTTTDGSTTTTPSSRQAAISSWAEPFFHQSDADQNGELSFEEYANAFAQFFHIRSEAGRFKQALYRHFDSLDMDQNGQLSFEEFNEDWKNPEKFQENYAQIIFETADEDGNGLIAYDEMVDFVAEQRQLKYRQRNELAADPDFRSYFDNADKNGDGNLDSGEFYDLLFPSEATTTAPFPSPPSFSSTTPSSSPTEETEEPATTENPRDEKWREFFNDADTDHDGQLSYQEFVVHLAAKINLSQGQTQKLMNLTSFRENFLSVDANGDNQLSFEEFRNLAPRFEALFVDAMFQLFDANENLLIDYNEWVDFFAEKMGLGYQERNKLASGTRIVKAFSAIDENKDAMIDKEEFTENMGIVFVMVRNFPDVDEPIPANAPTTESTTESPTTTTASATTTDTDEPEAESTTMTMEATTEMAPPLELVDNFRKFDKNGDGQWDFDEYVDFLADGMHIPDENRNRLEHSRIFRVVFEIFDENGDNELSMEEIWEKEKEMKQNWKIAVRYAFQLFDADDDGFVDYQELKQTVGEILYILDKEQMEERVDAMLYLVFEYADTNQDEMLDLDEFLAIFEEKNGFHIRSAEQMHMDMDTIKIVAKRMVGNDWTN